MDIDELRTIGQNSSANDGAGLLGAVGLVGWLLAIGLVVALGTGVVIAQVMRPDTLNPIQATALPDAESIDTDGMSARFDEAVESCLALLNRKKAKPNEAQQMQSMMSAMETQVLGTRSEKHGRLVVCVSEQRKHLLCHPEFRRGFVKIVETFMKTGSSGRARLALAESMVKHKTKGKEPSYLKHQRERQLAVPGISRLRYLFRNGYLQPDDFGSFFSGQPRWIKGLVGEDFKQKNACKGKA